MGEMADYYPDDANLWNDVVANAFFGGNYLPGDQSPQPHPEIQAKEATAVTKKMKQLAKALGLEAADITPEIRAMMQAAMAQQSATFEEILRLARQPAEPEVGRVVRFSKLLGNRLFTYVAYNAPNGWHMTGRSSPRVPLKWSQVLDFAGPNAKLLGDSGWVAL